MGQTIQTQTCSHLDAKGTLRHLKFKFSETVMRMKKAGMIISSQRQSTFCFICTTVEHVQTEEKKTQHTQNIKVTFADVNGFS